MKNKSIFLYFVFLLPLIKLWGQDNEAGAELFKKVDPSVVAIQIEQAGGSGMIVSSDGYIITNGHVISNATQENPLKVSKRITVILNDETKYIAKYIGHSMDPDVALIKIDPERPLSTVTFFDSSKVQTGQKCYALGMPIGHKRTLTSGIVSNAERIIGAYTPVIQTDAAINPGNSGGPLFNEKAEVIGINTYAGGGQNLGFTIPANIVVTLKEHFLKYGYFKRAIVPFFFTENIYEELGEALGITDGVLINFVEENSPAFKAGMRTGDIVVEKNGALVKARTLAQLLQFEWEMATQEISSQLQLKLLRKIDGKYSAFDFNATMIEEEPLPSLGGYQKGETRELFYAELGLGVIPLGYTARYAYVIPKTQGVLIAQITANSPAGRAGLLAGVSPDLITHINNTPITNIQMFEDSLNKALKEHQTYIVIKVLRGNIIYDTAIKPNYKFADKSLALIITSQNPTFWKEIIHFVYSVGLNVEVFSKTGEPLKIASTYPREKEIIIKGHETLDKFDPSKFDSIILLDGNKANSEQELNTFINKQLKEAIDTKKIIGAIGSTSLLLLAANDTIKQKKITTHPNSVEKIMKEKANYTGKDVETDENIITCTGIDEDNILAFFTKWKDALK